MRKPSKLTERGGGPPFSVPLDACLRCLNMQRTVLDCCSSHRCLRSQRTVLFRPIEKLVTRLGTSGFDAWTKTMKRNWNAVYITKLLRYSRWSYLFSCLTSRTCVQNHGPPTSFGRGNTKSTNRNGTRRIVWLWTRTTMNGRNLVDSHHDSLGRHVFVELRE